MPPLISFLATIGGAVTGGAATGAAAAAIGAGAAAVTGLGIASGVQSLTRGDGVAAAPAPSVLPPSPTIPTIQQATQAAQGAQRARRRARTQTRFVTRAEEASLLAAPSVTRKTLLGQ